MLSARSAPGDNHNFDAARDRFMESLFVGSCDLLAGVEKRAVEIMAASRITKVLLD